MSITTGAWLAAAAGCITGGIAAFMRGRSPSRGSLTVTALLGMLIAALGYGAFLLAGFAVSFLTFSGPPDTWPALLCVVLGCGGFLSLTWLQSVIGSRFGLPPMRAPRGRRSFQDLLDARPRGGPATMWLGGVGLALLPVSYGLTCLVTRKGKLGTLLWPSAVEGGAAIALGLGWIAVGAFLHFHFFFGLHPRLESHSRAGKYVALIAACLGLTIAAIWSVMTRLR